MQRLMKRAALSVLGVIVMLTYWTFAGGGDDTTVKGIPSKVWEGGAGILTLEVESTTPSRFSISFSGESDDRHLEAWTPVASGSQTWRIDIPEGAGGYIDLTADDPKVGDKLSWKISLNGETVDEQSETLDAPLPHGYAFGLQSFYEDYAHIDVEE